MVASYNSGDTAVRKPTEQWSRCDWMIVYKYDSTTIADMVIDDWVLNCASQEEQSKGGMEMRGTATLLCPLYYRYINGLPVDQRWLEMAVSISTPIPPTFVQTMFRGGGVSTPSAIRRTPQHYPTHPLHSWLGEVALTL